MHVCLKEKEHKKDRKDKKKDKEKKKKSKDKDREKSKDREKREKSRDKHDREDKVHITKYRFLLINTHQTDCLTWTIFEERRQSDVWSKLFRFRFLWINHN